MNYYDVLGVNKTATQAEIKSAYRKLASQHHPDRAGGDTQKFQQIQEAYDVLGNEDSRRKYDSGGSGSNPWSGYGTSRDFNEFEDFFQKWARTHKQYAKNPDVLVDVTVGLTTAYHGATAVPINAHGRTVQIDIPPGVRTGSKIRVAGAAPKDISELPPGDLYVRITIQSYLDISAVGDDLHMDVTISCFDAMLGSETTINHLSGKKIKVKIPRGSQQGDRLRLSGFGMPMPSHYGNRYGNLIIKLNINIPLVNDEEVLKKLSDIKETLGQ